MATRFYLPSTGATAITPAFYSGWSKTSEADRIQAVWTKISSGFATKACTENVSTDPYKVLNRQYIIGPIEAVNLRSTTWKTQIRCMEDAAKMNAQLNVYLYIVESDGTTRRGIQLKMGAEEFDDSTLVNRASGVATITNHADYEVSDGEYLSVEIGVYTTNTKTDVYTATMDFGDSSGTDLPENDTETTQYNPWVEFSATITAYTAPSGYVPKIIMIT